MEPRASGNRVTRCVSTQQSLPLVEARWTGAERGLIPEHESVCFIPGSTGQERRYALLLNQHDKASCRTQTVTVEQMGDRSATMIHWRQRHDCELF